MTSLLRCSRLRRPAHPAKAARAVATRRTSTTPPVRLEYGREAVEERTNGNSFASTAYVPSGKSSSVKPPTLVRISVRGLRPIGRKPSSVRRLKMTTAVIPQSCASLRRVRMHSAAQARLKVRDGLPSSKLTGPMRMAE